MLTYNKSFVFFLIILLITSIDILCYNDIALGSEKNDDDDNNINDDDTKDKKEKKNDDFDEDDDVPFILPLPFP